VKYLQDNVFLIVMALISGGMLLWPLIARRTGGPSVNHIGATRMINDVNAAVVDVRANGEFVAGHLPNSKNIPLADLEKRGAEVNKDKPVIVVCATGSSSLKAASALRKSGLTQVFVLDGGLQSWREAGMPIVK
jgi:rhodanese-related sulfurtransferase